MTTTDWGCSTFMFGVLFLVVGVALFYARNISTRSRKYEKDKVEEVFNKLVVSEGYSYISDFKPIENAFTGWKDKPSVNQAVSRADSGRTTYLADLVVQEEVSDTLTDENEEETPRPKKAKDAKVERYFTFLMVALDLPMTGSIHLKPKHELAGCVSDIVQAEGDIVPDAIKDFSKKYLARFDGVTPETVSKVLNDELQKTLVARTQSYPVNSDARWIIFSQNLLSVECCRIKDFEDLKKLVIFGEHLIERPKA